MQVDASIALDSGVFNSGIFAAICLLVYASYPACLREVVSCFEIDKKLRERRAIPIRKKIGINLASLFDICLFFVVFDFFW